MPPQRQKWNMLESFAMYKNRETSNGKCDHGWHHRDCRDFTNVHLSPSLTVKLIHGETAIRVGIFLIYTEYLSQMESGALYLELNT